MKNRIIRCVAAVALVGASAGMALGQTNLVAPSAPSIANRPSVAAPASTPTPSALPKRPDRPGIPGQPPPSQGVRNLVSDYQTSRQAFLKQQQELNRQLKTATEEQRTIIREQLKENLQQWMEQQKAQLQELREQAKDIKNHAPNLRDVIDSGGNEGRGR